MRKHSPSLVFTALLGLLIGANPAPDAKPGNRPAGSATRAKSGAKADRDAGARKPAKPNTDAETGAGAVGGAGAQGRDGSAEGVDGKEGAAEAGPSEAMRADVRRLLRMSGAGDLSAQVMNQMITQFRTTLPNVPGEFWDEFQKEIKPDELIELTAPAYEKHLTHEDVLGLIEFYESPVGKKLVQAQPLIARDAMVIGQQWGQMVNAKLVERLRKRGYLQQS